MRDTCIVGEGPGDSPGVRATSSVTPMKQLSHLPSPGLNTEPGSQRLTEKMLNPLVWIDHVDMKIS